MANKHLLKSLILVSSGLVIVICAYKIYKIREERAYVQEHSPSIKLPIIRRVRRIGNLSQPHLIFVRHHGKEYSLGTSSKYFRLTAKLDSMVVNYDAEQDIVVRTDEDVRGPWFLLFTVFLCGLAAIGKGMYDFYAFT